MDVLLLVKDMIGNYLEIMGEILWVDSLGRAEVHYPKIILNLF